ncbi:hypothetical protein ACOMHN_045972 [Nucella lapillus]
MTFTLNQLSFYDSAQHMMGALQSLAGSLSSCPITEKYFDSSLVRKGVYPYEYMDSWERFDEESLPPKVVVPKIVSLGLDTEYKNPDSELGSWLKRFFGLMFVAPRDVQDTFAFDYLDDMPDDQRCVDFTDYMLNT